MTNTQRLDQGLPRLDLPIDLAGLLAAAMLQAKHAAAEAWDELLRWG